VPEATRQAYRALVHAGLAGDRAALKTRLIEVGFSRQRSPVTGSRWMQ
jgi:hypothetical protein